MITALCLLDGPKRTSLAKESFGSQRASLNFFIFDLAEVLADLRDKLFLPMKEPERWYRL